MALWDDLRAEVIKWTNRPALINETDLALRFSIRAAHRTGKYWRDLTTVQSVPASQQIQQINLADECPGMRQIAYVKGFNSDLYLKPVEILDLLDSDGFARTNVYWAVGNYLNVRPYGSFDTGYEICYYQQPAATEDTVTGDWLTSQYQDVPVLMAASTVLRVVGEADIKAGVDAMLALAIADLQQDNIEVIGR